MIVNGRQIADEILESLKNEISSKKLKLRLVAVLIGNDPELEKFVQLKSKAAKKIGVEFKVFQFNKNIDEAIMIYHNEKISEDFNGVLVELPLPVHINQQKVLDAIPTEKDIDVLSSQAQRLFYQDKSKIFPPAVETLKMVFKKHNINPKNKKVTVFGQGILIGKPVSHWLERQGAEVYRIDEFTKSSEKYSKQADIVISGVGKPGLITGDMIKEGVVIIDFGYGKNEKGKMVGDVDFNSVSPKASLITPVPGGMGPILITAVLKNLVILNS